MTSRSAPMAGVGLVWYKRADYPRIRQIMVDAERLPPTFDKWQGQMEQREREVRRAGHTPYRVHIDPEQFVAWCADRNLEVNADARMQFASDPRNWPHHGPH